MVTVGQSFARDAAATATADEAVRIARRCGSPTAIAYCLFTAALANADRDPARALDLLDESLRLADAAANTWAVLGATSVRNSLLIQAGQYEAAAHACLDAARAAFEYGRREPQAISLCGVASSLVAQGNREPAAVLIGWAESIVGRLASIHR
jgi:hypothetical protein